MTKLRTNIDAALLFWRLSFGFAMLFGHGWGKLVQLSSGEPVQFIDWMGLGQTTSMALAAFAEVFCSLLLMLGLLTRLATIPLIITMLVAISLNLKGPFNDYELPLLYLCAYVGLLLSGPGAWSIDARLPRRYTAGAI